ncbi:hypothetical protein GM708_06745 [Vibrio cholerae]|nr:hypothetical protein [Vibrio cholerae]
MHLIALGCLAMGVASAIIGALIGADTVFLYMFVAFFCASVAGQLAHRVRSGRLWPAIPWREVVTLNLATLMTFGAFYLALVWIPASLVAGIEAAFAPLITLFIGLRVRRRVPALTWVLALGVLACSIAFGAAQNQTLAIPGPQYITGVALALTAGAGMAVLASVSHRLGERGVSAASILAVRYHLAYVVALLLALRENPLKVGLPDLLGSLVWMVPLGIAAVVLPLFLIQSGMMRTDPTLTTVIMAGLPAISFLTEAILLGSRTTVASWALLVLLVALIGTYGVIDVRRTQPRL